jgi:hypothetical protein
MSCSTTSRRNTETLSTVLKKAAGSSR